MIILGNVSVETKSSKIAPPESNNFQLKGPTV